MHKKIFALTLVSLLAACSTSTEAEKTIAGYSDVSSKVHLGDLKSDVLGTLGPTQVEKEDKKWEEKHDTFTKDGASVEVYYFRSSPYAKGLTKEDQYTPYIFSNDRLLGIGWGMLSEEKSKGKTVPTFNAGGTENTETVY